MDPNQPETVKMSRQSKPVAAETAAVVLETATAIKETALSQCLGSHSVSELFPTECPTSLVDFRSQTLVDTKSTVLVFVMADS